MFLEFIYRQKSLIIINYTTTLSIINNSKLLLRKKANLIVFKTIPANSKYLPRTNLDLFVDNHYLLTITVNAFGITLTSNGTVPINSPSI